MKSWYFGCPFVTLLRYGMSNEARRKELLAECVSAALQGHVSSFEEE